jgi:acetolactate synthase-1/2/3 large subunit
LNKARRPVLIAGNGLSAGKTAFYSLMNYLSIPVIPSWKAMDYIANTHPLYAGRVGGMGDRAGNLAMQNADLIISLGCRMDFSITGFDRGRWTPAAKKIVVDIDPSEIRKLESAGDLFPVIADTADVIAELLAHKDEIHTQDLSLWKEKIARWKQKYPVISCNKYTNAQGGLTTYALVDTLCRYLPNNAHIAPCSSGTTAEIFFQAFTVKQGQTVRSNHGLGSMGFEIPNAIGMCVASGNKDTVCIAGDGGMQLNIQELSVIRGRDLPVKIFVINNHGYASIRNMQNNHFVGHHAGCDVESGLFLPDAQKISAAYEIPYFRVQNEAELADTVQAVLREKGPALCEVLVDGECLVTPRSAMQIMRDGSMRSSPLENQFPFLSEDEVAANRVV